MGLLNFHEKSITNKISAHNLKIFLLFFSDNKQLNKYISVDIFLTF